MSAPHIPSSDRLDYERDKLAELVSLEKEMRNLVKSFDSALRHYDMPDEVTDMANTAADAASDLAGLAMRQQDEVDRLELYFHSRPRQRFESAIDAAE